MLIGFLLVVALLAVALISALSAEPGEVRGLPRGLWVVMILLLPLVGPVLYLSFGRPVRRAGGELRRASSPAPRTVAPDDDPEFLRRLRGATDGRTSDDRPTTDS